MCVTPTSMSNSSVQSEGVLFEDGRVGRLCTRGCARDRAPIQVSGSPKAALGAVMQHRPDAC